MNLDKLLSDALKHAHELKHAGSVFQQSLEAALVHREIQHRYGPQNWKSARLIELIWTNDQNESYSLGMFREMLHPKSGGRKLTRIDHCPLNEEIQIEFCYGEHWVEPRQPVARETSVLEILELRERFDELMREVEEGVWS
jgi:hypothetical protein